RSRCATRSTRSAGCARPRAPDPSDRGTAASPRLEGSTPPASAPAARPRAAIPARLHSTIPGVRSRLPRVAPGSHRRDRSTSSSSDLKVLKAIAEALNAADSVDRALQTTLEQVAALLGLDAGWIWLTDPSSGRFYSAVAHGLP